MTELHASITAAANGYTVRYGSQSEAYVFESFAAMTEHLRSTLPVFQPNVFVTTITAGKARTK